MRQTCLDAKVRPEKQQKKREVNEAKINFHFESFLPPPLLLLIVSSKNDLEFLSKDLGGEAKNPLLLLKKTRFACASVTGATAHAPHFAGEAERKGRERSTMERGAVERKGCGNCVANCWQCFW